ncbi:MAG: hypothetical protein BWK77_01600 [Verrucomicrobia bacterium A1]|nr:MAG: hypothetical protein BWK77_01600 [Verrucomicrobia bacterium A1]
MRTIVDLPADQIRELGRVCDGQKISRAEAVRRAVAEFLTRRGPAGGSLAGFGLWKGRRIDGVRYQMRMRAEWDERDRGTGHEHRH